MLTPGLAALALLTRVPVHRVFTAAETVQGVPFFPVIGILVGVGQILLLRLLGPFLPPLLLSVCLIAAAAWLTGALHLDGLADMADGFGGGRSREDILRIMRDSAIGTYGAVAVVLMVTVRASALNALIERRAAAPFLLLAPTLSRWTIVALSYALPYARSEGGLGAVVAGITWQQLTRTTAITAVLTASAGSTYATAAWIAAISVTLALGRWCHCRLEGFTGDTLGANSELTEAAVLIAGVVLTR